MFIPGTRWRRRRSRSAGRLPPLGSTKSDSSRAGGSTRSKAAHSSPHMTPPASSSAAAGTPEPPVSGTRISAASRIPPDPTSSPAAPDPRRRNVDAYPFIIYYSSRQNWRRKRRKKCTTQNVNKFLFKGCGLWNLGGLRPDMFASHSSETWLCLTGGADAAACRKRRPWKILHTCRVHMYIRKYCKCYFLNEFCEI